MLKCYSVLALSSVTEEISAYNKAAIVISVTFEEIKASENVRNAALRHIQMLKRVSNKWKSLLALKNTRKLILRNMWDRTVHKLIQKHSEKTKKGILKKLQGITQVSSNKALDNYYNLQKNQHHKNLAKAHKTNKKNTVIFKYIPTNEHLTKLIYNAANINHI